MMFVICVIRKICIQSLVSGIITEMRLLTQGNLEKTKIGVDSRRMILNIRISAKIMIEETY
jgi:hypothetical protein